MKIKYIFLTITSLIVIADSTSLLPAEHSTWIVTGNDFHPLPKLIDLQIPSIAHSSPVVAPELALALQRGTKRKALEENVLAQYQCPTCGKQLDQKSHFDEHLRVHTGERPYACSSCNKRFKATQAKNRHEKTHTVKKASVGGRKGKLEQYDQAIVEDAVNLFKSILNQNGQPQQLTCSLCSYQTLTTKTSFLRHIKSHAMIKEFPCSICQMGFTRKSSVKDHIKKQHPEHIGL